MCYVNFLEWKILKCLLAELFGFIVCVECHRQVEKIG